MANERTPIRTGGGRRGEAKARFALASRAEQAKVRAAAVMQMALDEWSCRSEAGRQ